MPHGLNPNELREAFTKNPGFFPTCPYFSIAGSQFCRPHTIMNGAVTPDIEQEVNEWLTATVHHYATGYLNLHQGTLYRDGSYPHRFCTNGVGITS